MIKVFPENTGPIRGVRGVFHRAAKPPFKYEPFCFLAVGAAFLVISAVVWASVPVMDWRMAGPFGGTATTVTLDSENPTIVLAGARDSLLYQSRDSGETWDLVNFPKHRFSEVTSILVDPADSKHYLVGTTAAEGGGLYESHDQGKTWTASKSVENFGVRALAASVSQPSRFVAGTAHGVMLSDDSGRTWTRISDPNNLEMHSITAVAIDTKSPDVIYAGTAHLPWKTTDAGKTWESIHNGMIDDSDVFSLYIDPTMPSTILASACSGIYESENRGDVWRKLLGIPNTSRRTHVIREDPSNPSTIFAGTTTGLFKSINHGLSWKTLITAQVNALAFDPAHPGNLYLALEYEGLGKSHDNGEAIDPINKGFVDRVISSVTVSGDRLLALESQEGETSGIFFSEDHGETWSQLRNIRGLGGVHLKAITGVAGADRILLAAGTHQLYKSLDSGLSWKPLPVRLIIQPPAQVARPQQANTSHTPRSKATNARARVIRPIKPKPIIKEVSPSEIAAFYSVRKGTGQLTFAATDLGLLTSTDAGDHWTLAEIPDSPAVTALYPASGSSGYLIAQAATGLFATHDFGDHWTQIWFPLPVSDINEIAISPEAGSSSLLVATRVGLYYSNDGGEKWSMSQAGLPASTVNSVVYTGSEKTAYAVEYGQLYLTNDAGISWSALPTSVSSLQIQRLWMPDKTSSRLYGITSDLGILFRD